MLPGLMTVCILISGGYLNKAPAQEIVLTSSASACHKEAARSNRRVTMARSFRTEGQLPMLEHYCGLGLKDCARVGFE